MLTAAITEYFPTYSTDDQNQTVKRWIGYSAVIAIFNNYST